MAGPRRPQDRVALPKVWDSFVDAFQNHLEPDPKPTELGRFVGEGGNPDEGADERSGPRTSRRTVTTCATARS